MNYTCIQWRFLMWTMRLFYQDSTVSGAAQGEKVILEAILFTPTFNSLQ